MNVDTLVTRIDTYATQIAQVVTAAPGGSQTPVNTSSALVTLLKSYVSDRMHPVTIRNANTHPSIVYQLVSSTAAKVDGFLITQTDTFVLSIRATTYDALVTVTNNVIGAINSSGSAIEVTDMLFDFDADQSAYRCNLEIEYTYLVAGAQTLPAAYVYCLGRNADESVYDNFVKQRVTNDYAIVIVRSGTSSPRKTMDQLCTNVMSALLGWSQSPTFNEFQYRSGSQIEGVGGLEMWREIYSDSEYVSQS